MLPVTPATVHSRRLSQRRNVSYWITKISVIYDEIGTLNFIRFPACVFDLPPGHWLPLYGCKNRGNAGLYTFFGLV